MFEREWDDDETRMILRNGKKSLQEARLKRRNAVFTAVIRGWTQERISMELGISQQRVSQIFHEEPIKHD